MSVAAKTHQEMSFEFDGCPSRWSRGYKWLIKHMFLPLIGPQALRKWARQFPAFAEDLRTYIQRDKERIKEGEAFMSWEWSNGMQKETSIFSVLLIVQSMKFVLLDLDLLNQMVQVTKGKISWYIKQRSFYDGYRSGMEACAKVLTICLQNGLTGCLYGPTSG